MAVEVKAWLYMALYKVLGVKTHVQAVLESQGHYDVRWVVVEHV